MTYDVASIEDTTMTLIFTTFLHGIQSNKEYGEEAIKYSLVLS